MFDSNNRSQYSHQIKRSKEQLIYDMLLLLNQSTFGLSASRTVELMGLPFQYKKKYFDDILINKGLVQVKIKSLRARYQYDFDFYEVTGKGLRFMEYYKEIISILE